MSEWRQQDLQNRMHNLAEEVDEISSSLSGISSKIEESYSGSVDRISAIERKLDNLIKYTFLCFECLGVTKEKLDALEEKKEKAMNETFRKMASNEDGSIDELKDYIKRG